MIDKNISIINFNDGLLDRAMREDIPLIEKLALFGITHSNINEFISVKFAEAYFHFKNKTIEVDEQGDNNYKEKYKNLMIRLNEFNSKQENIFKKLMVKLNIEAKVNISSIQYLPNIDNELIDEYFNNISTVLTPIAVNSRTELPCFKNDDVNFFVGFDDGTYGFLQIPNSIRNLLKVNNFNNDYNETYIYTEDIIFNKLNTIFSNKNIVFSICFQVNKEYTAELNHDLQRYIVDRMKEVLKKRDYASCIYLRISKKFSSNVTKGSINKLLKILSIPKSHVHISYEPISLSIFKNKPIKIKELEYTKDKSNYTKINNIFKYLDNKDILLHHPFDSYNTILDFIHQAAIDKNVVYIKQTLYRVSSPDSPIVNALCDAAILGKQVTVMLEIMARFDERQNISLVSKLKDSGVNIIYSLDKYKTHCKMCIVGKLKNKKIKEYAHIATGNYNEKTAKIYTDFSLLTANENITKQLVHIFNYLTGFGNIPTLDNPIVFTSPVTLKNKLIEEINNCITNKGSMIIKCNNMAEMDIMDNILHAVESNIKIDIIVRSIMTFEKELFEKYPNIVYHSILGKYLEHSRVYVFSYNSITKVYISSADLLHRNLNKRIELMVEIVDEDLRKRILDILDVYIKDDTNNIISEYKGTINSHKLLFNI